eukprot:TRINITY_DN9178_c0_g2_i2.p1 TRINITY_DN9178_c0_g2~~TRINITY_DN9178_c0_g2_i2.p1  ORF type:complete len:621 (+),score=101.61 TRINITY_DN9178_c0_g2_i2:86-1948(+)
MPSPKPYPEILRDSWDLDHAERLGVDTEWLACAPTTEDANGYPSNGCMTILVEDGKAKMAETMSTQRRPPLDGDWSGVQHPERNCTAMLVNNHLLLYELHVQRSLLRRHLDDAFDAMECHLKSEVQTHHQPHGSADVGMLPRDVPPSPRSHNSGSTDLSESAIKKDDAAFVNEGEMHRIASHKRLARTMSSEHQSSDVYRRKMKALGGYNVGPVGTSCTFLERLRSFTEHRGFEMFFAVLIVLNTLNMSIEYQYKSLDVCYNIGFPKCTRPAKQLWQGAEDIFYYLDLAFGFTFTAEVSLKLISQHIDFFKFLWNYIDSLSLLGWYLVLLSDADLIVSPMLLRLARIARLLRFLRLVKAVQMFDVLCLLIGSLRASVAILLWSSLLLLLIMCSAALVSHTLILNYINDESLSLEVRHEAYIVFGSFVRSFLTIHGLTFSLDINAAWVVFELNEWFAVPLLMYQILVSFAVIKVIEAVFLQETIKLAATNDDLVIMEKNRWEAMQETKVRALFNEADESGDGYVDYDEFMMIMSDDKVVSWLEAIDVEVEDPRMVWELLCSWSKCPGGSKLNAQAFVKGVGRLKGWAKSLDLLRMLRELGDLKAQMGVIDEAIRPKLPPPV